MPTPLSADSPPPACAIDAGGDDPISSHRPRQPHPPTRRWLQQVVLFAAHAMRRMRFRIDALLLIAEAAEEALDLAGPGGLDRAAIRDLTAIAAIARAATGDMAWLKIAIAVEMARQDGEAFDQLPPEQRQSDLDQADWMLRTIQAAASSTVRA